MENNNLSPPQDGEPAGDWRSTLQLDARVNDWRMRLPFSGIEGLLELWKISARFEEKIYTDATSQSDYLWKIVMKIRTVEEKSQNIMVNSLQSSSAGSSSSNPNQGSFNVQLQPQFPNPWQSLFTQLSADQSQAHQQPISQNLLNNIPPAGVQSSARLSSALTPAYGLTWTPVPSIVEQYNSQNLSHNSYSVSGCLISLDLTNTNTWRPPQVGESVIDARDWRSQLRADSRQKIINRIMDTLKRDLPVSGQEGLLKHKKIALRVEEKIYTTATSQSDYLRRLSLEMIGMATRSQNSMANSFQSNSAVLLGSLDSMRTNNWRPPQVGEPAMAAGDWRSQLQADSRLRIVNKIMDTLKRHLPFSGHEGLQQLMKIAVIFEEKSYIAATSQSDYLRKISLKTLTMETKFRNSMANSLQCNSDGNSNRPPIPGVLRSLDSMRTNNWRPPHWRSQFLADSRQRIVHKIMDTLKEHPPFPCREGLQEVMEIAVRIEEKTYAAATSQSDYLRRLSVKMLTMVTKSQTRKAPSNLKRRRVCASHD